MRFLIILFFTAGIAAAEEKKALPLPEQVTPRVVADLSGYSEGIVFNDSGDAFVSLLRRRSVFRVPRGGVPSLWLEVIEPNGHKILGDGTHLVAARGGVHHVSPSGHILHVFSSGMTTPNDIALDGDGGAYVSVPAESLPDRKKRLSAVYYISADRQTKKVAGDFCYPNGIVVQSDGRALFVNDSCSPQIFRFDIQKPGELSNRSIFANLPDPEAVLDGMTFDLDGRLYVADYGTGTVLAFDKTGRSIRRFPTGMRRTSNVAFGGPGLRDLYVTGAPATEDGVGQLVVLPLGIAGRSSLAVPKSLGGK